MNPRITIQFRDVPAQLVNTGALPTLYADKRFRLDSDIVFKRPYTHSGRWVDFDDLLRLIGIGT